MCQKTVNQWSVRKVSVLFSTLMFNCTVSHHPHCRRTVLFTTVNQACHSWATGRLIIPTVATVVVVVYHDQRHITWLAGCWSELGQGLIAYPWSSLVTRMFVTQFFAPEFVFRHSVFLGWFSCSFFKCQILQYWKKSVIEMGCSFLNSKLDFDAKKKICCQNSNSNCWHGFTSIDVLLDG